LIENSQQIWRDTIKQAIKSNFYSEVCSQTEPQLSLMWVDRNLKYGLALEFSQREYYRQGRTNK